MKSSNKIIKVISATRAFCGLWRLQPIESEPPVCTLDAIRDTSLVIY